MNRSGLNAGEYLRKIRIEQAVLLLHETQKTVSDIGFDCGFCNTSYFIKIFREKMGMMPAEYRQQKADDAGDGACDALTERSDALSRL